MQKCNKTSTKHKYMKINGLAVCVDYSNYLHKSIYRWKNTLDTLLVVTSNQDTATQQLCESYEIPYCCTDAFYLNGAKFNKGLAMEEARQIMPWKDWILFFDADIIPDINWKSQIGQADPTRLNGAARYDQKPDGSITMIDDGGRVGWGYFQLFHSQDSHVQRRPLMDGSWKHAGGYDNSFVSLWPEPAKRLPTTLIHMGPNGNWFGVGRQQEYHEMQERRRRNGGHVQPEERFQ